MLIHSLITLGGIVLLVFGAEGVVRGGSSLALRFGITPLSIGLTIVAFGTSAPELVVSITAGMQGKGDISIGNVIGSNIFNIAVILAITALIQPVRIVSTVIRVDIPVMIGVTLVGIWLINRGPITTAAGAMLVLALAAYVTLTYRLARAASDSDAKLLGAAAVPAVKRSLAIDCLYILVGLLLLVVGSRLMVESVSQIALLLGVSEAVIGLTVVAVGTSLPELATSAVAAYRHQQDMAIGNLVGSNIFNILGILGASAMVSPLEAPGVSWINLAVMLFFSIVLLPLAWTQRILQRWEGGLLLFGYGLYLWWLRLA